jgi:hypothetical protein
MKNIVTREAHRKWTREDPFGISSRQGVVSGALFGAGICLAMALTGRWLRFPPEQILKASLAGLFGGGAVIGLTVRAVVRWAIFTQLARDYDEPVAADLARDFAWRLRCAWLRGPQGRVFGGLYLNGGGDRLHFAPDAYSIPLETSFDIAAGPAAIACAKRRLAADSFSSLFVWRRTRVLEIAADGAPYRFSVPSPEKAVARLRAVLSGDDCESEG